MQFIKRLMEISWLESWARHFITRFLGRYISTGCLILEEEGGETFTFQGINTIKYSLQVILRVHNPQFYWKVMTRADVGFADAYIDGDFTLEDKDDGLLNFFMLIFANGEVNKSITKVKKTRWTPMFSTALISSSKLFFKHVMRQNSLTQARRNISRHYDLVCKIQSFSCVLQNMRIFID
ncbi:hypothetical protein Tsubulata_021172 [Turnera subulata]|uniref:Uncharacterized protein n=1 Tax=Turnera subulata TaxID=218843 RepID=A0A9Q0FLQ9_9ROSI|nr:hypothetical protein Tsubulata_021172 [Turnera subulata]